MAMAGFCGSGWVWSSLAGADEARFDPVDRSLLLEGHVRYKDRGTQVVSDMAEFASDTGSAAKRTGAATPMAKSGMIEKPEPRNNFV